jgi:hypothetical protein
MGKAAGLATRFKKPDYSDYQAPQTSFRLNVLVTAKLKAITEMFPDQTMNQIVNQLLSAALDDFEVGLKGERYLKSALDTGEEIVFWESPEVAEEFLALANKYAEELVAKIKQKGK